MELLASYNDDSSTAASPKQSDSHLDNKPADALEDEWLSFEKMIAPGADSSKPVNSSSYLVDGMIAYPGMKSKPNQNMNTEELASVVQSSESSEDENDDGQLIDEDKPVKSQVEEDDAFFKMRKKVKERDRSSSTDRSSSSGSSSTSRSGSPAARSPSPPRLSPVNSVRSHTSDPPDLQGASVSEGTSTVEERLKEIAEAEVAPLAESKEGDEELSKSSRHRKRTNSDRSRSKHGERGSSRSKKRHHRSRSRSHNRKHHSSRDKHRHKDKKSRHSDRKRSRSKEHRKSEKKHSRSRSRDRKDKRDHRRSRSRDRKSRDKKHKHRSRSRGRRSSPEKERRSRSRSRERLRSRSPVMGRKLSFKEQMRKDILNASKQAAATAAAAGEKESVSADVPVRKLGDHLRPADLLKGVKISGGESVTPQMVLMQTMAAMHKKAQELTGVEVPKYYNPAAVNPLKYAEQVQKRKLLWSKKPDEKQKEKDDQIESQWKSAYVADDDKATSKFRKLMGMKEGVNDMSTVDKNMTEEQKRRQAELFQRLDQEYEFARMTTHTQRGVGLGFSSQVYDPNHPPTTHDST